MILSKANLQVVATAKPDNGIAVLDTVHFEDDGSSVASNSKCVVVCGPVAGKVKERVVIADSGACALTITSSTIREVMKNVPADKQFGGLLEHIDLREDGMFSLSDGKRKRKIVGQVYSRKYVDYRKIVSEVVAKKKTCRVVLNLSRTLAMLEAIKNCVGDGSGAEKVFVEFTDDNDMILRCRSGKTGQRVVATTTTYKYKNEDGGWLTEDTWEQSAFGKEKTFHRRGGHRAGRQEV
jgi:hypothetical protein